MTGNSAMAKSTGTTAGAAEIRGWKAVALEETRAEGSRGLEERGLADGHEITGSSAAYCC